MLTIFLEIGINAKTIWHLRARDFLFMVPIAAALMYVPVTFAGLGIQETVYVFILTNLNAPFENALSFALLVRILFTGTDIIGLPSLAKTGTRIASMLTGDSKEPPSL